MKQNSSPLAFKVLDKLYTFFDEDYAATTQANHVVAPADHVTHRGCTYTLQPDLLYMHSCSHHVSAVA